MSKAKPVAGESKLPPQGFSKFSRGPSFGFQKVIGSKAQFTPPAIRITQNKGGGGK